jgi:radical SAM superfamily enzyme YgiQ (UPF0313 family)
MDVAVVDAKLERLDAADTVSRVCSLEPSLVGATSMTHDVVSAGEIAEGVKARAPSVLTAVGGVHATALPHRILSDFPSFDFAVLGEGEETLVELVRALSSGSPLDAIHGLAWRNGESTRENEPRARKDDLDALPLPAWDLFPDAREYHVITARGCPYQCVFCTAPYGHKIRERSPENVLAEMYAVAERYQPRHYRINDESFAFKKERGERIVAGIKEHEELRAIPKAASLRANSVYPELMEGMRDAGFVYVDFGVESGDPEILTRIKKRVTMDELRHAVAVTKRAGIKVGGNYIIGHPGETPATIRKTIRFAVELNCDFNAFGIMTPYPGTEIYQMAERGEWGYRLRSTDWRDFNKQLGGALEITGLPRYQLELYQLLGYVSVYLANLRFLSFARFVWDFRRSALAFLKNFVVHFPTRGRSRRSGADREGS